MMVTNLRPRSDQIEELTRDVELPLSPLRKVHLEIIAEMLEQAWRDLKSTQGSTLSTGSETEVTSLMEIRINKLLDDSALWASLVQGTARGGESLNYDGTKLEKRPDLSLQLTDRSRNFPLKVECKLIDSSSGKSVRLYCKEGLLRFVQGEYAWATQEAFMLAYVRDGSSTTSVLTPHLKTKRTTKENPYHSDVPEQSNIHGSLDLSRSRHGRPFTYIGNVANDDPGSIELWHLWVST